MSEQNTSYSPKTIIVSVLVICLCIILFPVYELLNFNVPYQTELKKCPFCIGSNMCNCFLNNAFKLSWDHFWTNLLNIILKKKLIFGSCGSQMVVLKWIEGDQHFNSNPDVTVEYSNINTILESMKRLSLGLSNSHGLGPQDFVLCPSTDKLGSLLKHITDRSVSNTKAELYQNIFYSLQVSMEPLLQQIPPPQETDQIPDSQTLRVCLFHFSRVMAEVRNNFLNRNLPSPTRNIRITDEWAVAHYLGACGDISVSEYCGQSLTSVFPKLSWEQRSSIARQLLQLAFNATFENAEFAFYFTDLSPDNFAVSDNSKVRLVDLDNVIVVDKDQKDVPDDWDTTHMSYHDDKIEGFAFSTNEICSHRISDTNVYAICQGILSERTDLLEGGLLHSPPQHLSGLKKLVEDCTSPPAGLSRFDIASSILQVLDVSVQESV